MSVASDVLAAVRDAVATASAPDVAAGQVKARAALEVNPDRDKPLPVVVVAPTPFAPAVTRRRLGWREKVYPVTALLAAPKDPAPAAAAGWRVEWAARVGTALFGRPAGMPGGTVRVEPDGLTQLDTRAYDAAGLWVAAVPLLVTVRSTLWGNP